MLKTVVSEAARQDIVHALANSRKSFGYQAQRRYRNLIQQAILDLAESPQRLGAKERHELGAHIFSYHISRSHHSRQSPEAGVKNPRHVFFYTIDHERVVFLRLLHDSMDFSRHLPEGRL